MITVQTTTFDGKKVAKPFAWSYSALKNYETCPFRYQQIDLLKNIKEPESMELKDGFAVHKALADRIDHARPLPPTMLQYEKWVDYVMTGVDRTQMTFGAERKLAITAEFKPCDYFDKIKPVWLRTVADVLRVHGDVCHIVDWKTGKVKPDPDQLMLIATCVAVHFPKVTKFCAELVWLGHDTKTTVNFEADALEAFWGDNMSVRVKKFRQARETNDFPTRPSGLCRRWCPVTTCEHCGAGE